MLNFVHRCLWAFYPGEMARTFHWIPKGVHAPKYAQTTHNQLPLRKQQRYDNDSQALSTIHLYMMVLVRDGWVHGRRRESVYECMYERVRKQTKNHLILRQLS